MIAALVAMAGWDLYICLRVRPDLPTTLINLSFLGVPLLLALAATGRAWRSLAFGITLTFLFQRLHALKWRYLGATWTAADVRMLLDPGNWIVVLQYPLLVPLIAAGVALLLSSWLLVPKGRRIGPAWRAAALVGALAFVLGDVSWRHRHEFDPFGFTTHGHFANLVFSASSLGYRAPDIEGDSALFVTRAREVAPSAVAPAGRRPDIVVWLQESTMDLRLLDIPGATLPTLPMYEPRESTRAGGWLRVHSWGGGTWLSEFALLTGLFHDDFGAAGNGVYYTVTSRLRFSLPKLLREAGYETAVLTGAPKGFYNAEAAYRDFGFEQVLNPTDFAGGRRSGMDRNLTTDEELQRHAHEVLVRPRDKPLFLFVLSVIQHGPYDASHAVGYGLDRSPLDRASAARLSDYVTRMEATSAATLKFWAEIRGRARPIVFAYFGDHQPNLDHGLLYPEGFAAPRYVTAYSVESNVPGPPAAARAPRPLDISYLGGRILELAGVPLDPLFAANRAMRVLCDGALADCQDTALTQSYRAHIYGDLAAAPR